MLLYDSAVSGNCYKVRLLCAQLDLAYERREVDVVQRSGRRELLGDLNPALRVPTLVLDDDRPLGESDAILCYLAEGTPYLPTDRYEAAHGSGSALPGSPMAGGWRRRGGWRDAVASDIDAPGSTRRPVPRRVWLHRSRRRPASVGVIRHFFKLQQRKRR